MKHENLIAVCVLLVGLDLGGLLSWQGGFVGMAVLTLLMLDERRA